MHYTNPEHQSGGRDSSGLRLVYTPRLRPNDMGVLTLGTRNFAVPPGESNFSIAPNVAPGGGWALLGSIWWGARVHAWLAAAWRASLASVRRAWLSRAS